MSDDDKKKRNNAVTVMIMGIVINFVGFFVYMASMPSVYSPSYLSELMRASTIMMIFLTIGGIISLVGFVMLLDWYRSKPQT